MTVGDLRLKALGVPVVLVSASDAAVFSRYSVLDGTDIAESRQIQNVWWPSLRATVSAAETQRPEHDLQITTRGWSTGTVPSPCRPAVDDTRSVPYHPCRWRHGNLCLSRFDQWRDCPDRESVGEPVHRAHSRNPRPRNRLHAACFCPTRLSQCVAPGVRQPRWMFSRSERFSSCPAVEYILVEGISHEHSRGSYFGAHSFSTIGDLKGPTLGSTVPGALGGPGVFLLFAGLAAISAIVFVVGTRIRPPEPQNRHPR